MHALPVDSPVARSKFRLERVISPYAPKRSGRSFSMIDSGRLLTAMQVRCVVHEHVILKKLLKVSRILE